MPFVKICMLIIKIVKIGERALDDKRRKSGSLTRLLQYTAKFAMRVTYYREAIESKLNLCIKIPGF